MPDTNVPKTTKKYVLQLWHGTDLSVHAGPFDTDQEQFASAQALWNDRMIIDKAYDDVFSLEIDQTGSPTITPYAPGAMDEDSGNADADGDSLE